MKITSTGSRVLIFFILLMVFLLAYLYAPVNGKIQSVELTDSGSFFFFAHRGVCDDSPENSFASFRAADSVGMQGLEIDIRISADTELVIFHDPDGLRMLGYNLVIAETTLEQLKKARLLVDSAQTGETIHSLDEYFDAFGSRFIAYLDIKPVRGFKKYPVARKLVRLLMTHDATERTIVASYDIRFLAYLKMIHPGIRTALEGFNAGKEWMYGIIPGRYRPDFLSSFGRQVDKKHVEWITRKGLLNRRIIYDVDSTNFNALKETGLKCMIIDYGSYLEEYLQ